MSQRPSFAPENLQALIDASPFHQFLRMVVDEVDLEAGRLVLRLPYRPEYRRMEDPPQVHGGPVASVIDIAGTFAVGAVVGHGVPTINLRIDYMHHPPRPLRRRHLPRSRRHTPRHEDDGRADHVRAHDRRAGPSSATSTSPQ